MFIRSAGYTLAVQSRLRLHSQTDSHARILDEGGGGMVRTVPATKLGVKHRNFMLARKNKLWQPPIRHVEIFGVKVAKIQVF